MQVKTAKQIFPKMRRNADADLKLIKVLALTSPGEQANENEQSVGMLDKVEFPAKSNLNKLAEAIENTKQS
jgi:hypothetical protein